MLLRIRTMILLITVSTLSGCSSGGGESASHSSNGAVHRFADLPSCRLSTNPNSLVGTCSNKQAPNISIPALYDGTSATEYVSEFGAKYMRLSLPTGLTDGAVTQMFPDYAKVSAWNSDGSKLWVFSQNGFLHLYDGNTYAYLEEITSAKGFQYSGQDPEPRWSNTDPNILYYVAGMKLNAYHINTHTTSTLHTFTNAEIGTTGCTYIHNGDEGNSDDSDRYWAFYCIDGSYTQQGVFVYDRQTDSVLSHKGYGAGGLCGAGACATTANWVGVSHSGNHILVNWNIDAADGDLTTRGLGQEVFDSNLNYLSKSSVVRLGFCTTFLAFQLSNFV